MSSPIKAPEVPYVGHVEGGFSDGHLVRIQGFTAPVANRFNINLQCDGSDDADIAVHISVRLQEGYVARNSFENGEWGEEQGDGNLTIGTGQRFEVLVLSAANDYKVAINGQHFCEFPHRIAPSKITHLKIDGDVSVSLISYEGGDMEKSSSSQQNTSFGQQQPNYGGYGPPQQGGYGGYGPGPQGYGPPPPGYQPYGQQGGYGAPPPPGYHQEHDQGGLGDFLGTASEVIAGAIKSGMADKLLGSLTGGNQQHGQQQGQYGQYPHPQQGPPQQQPQQPSFNFPQLGGGGSIGGLGSVGSLLTGFADQILHPKRNPGGPPPAGINLPSAPSAPSAPMMEDDKPNLYPSIPSVNDKKIPGGPDFPSYPSMPGMPGATTPSSYPTSPGGIYNDKTLPGGSVFPSYPFMPGMPGATTPSSYPTSPGGMANPGFRPPPPGGFPSMQSDIGANPRNPHPVPTGTNVYPRSPSYPQAPWTQGYPTQPTYPRHPSYPSYPSYPRYPGNQNYANYQGGGAAGGNNAPVPEGYYVYKPKDMHYTNDKDSSTMDKVKKYGLPIIGAGVATYALSKLTDGFGLGGHSSDSD